MLVSGKIVLETNWAALVLALILATSPAVAATIDDAASPMHDMIPIEAHAGAYVIPVLINGELSLKFTVDSGAADVSIPAEVAWTLKEMGTMTSRDLLGKKTYVLADGSKVSSEIYRMASLTVGRLIMRDVTVRVAAENSGLLLGQSFLRRLKSWSVDNDRQVLIIN